ncbi:Hypothetical protein CAP_4986 [Chondromyces apiculatus DSM 436]|uniref:Uncharacterized protein n=1 Tax=Chondromyces apiculatus DSM 436 TaxID=1192034 RepID=A0A017THQ2_9BACT|nr:Hypothetical protein CAP_4986 [Chondromyces apiculatus DSM 436]
MTARPVRTQGALPRPCPPSALPPASAGCLNSGSCSKAEACPRCGRAAVRAPQMRRRARLPRSARPAGGLLPGPRSVRLPAPTTR